MQDTLRPMTNINHERKRRRSVSGNQGRRGSERETMEGRVGSHCWRVQTPIFKFPFFVTRVALRKRQKSHQSIQIVATFLVTRLKINVSVRHMRINGLILESRNIAQSQLILNRLYRKMRSTMTVKRQNLHITADQGVS
jgi:hypothetical protein